jgi:hypothetical protein
MTDTEIIDNLNHLLATGLDYNSQNHIPGLREIVNKRLKHKARPMKTLYERLVSLGYATVAAHDPKENKDVDAVEIMMDDHDMLLFPSGRLALVDHGWAPVAEYQVETMQETVP